MRFLIILVLLFLCVFAGVSQSQLLEKRVTLHYKEARLATILAGIKAKYGVGFSYTNNHIPLDRKMTLSVTDQSLAEALHELFKESGIRYNQVAGQIVLTKGTESPKKPKPARKALPKTTQGMSQPEDQKEKEPDLTATASLLPIPVLEEESPEGNPKSLETLEKEYKSEKRTLEKNYLSQVDAALENNDSSMVADLKKDFRALGKSLKRQFELLAEKAKSLPWPSLKIPESDSTKSTFTPTAQVSVVPPLSTNGANNIHCVNRVSFNIFAGHSLGVDGFEIGSIANLVNEDVKGAQISGVTNIVGGSVEGTQIAGYLNINKGRLEAVQLAGFVNISGSDSSNGVQAAGFGNVHKGDILGVQAAGFFNVNGGYVIGPQAAGFINVSGGAVSGTQLAGFMNVGRQNLKGVQAAGFMNVGGRHVLGTQIAGFMNVARRDIRGVQVAGFLNAARKVHGSQIGLFNVADSVSGIQFGFFNFSRKGYRRFELFAMERMQTNVAFKMGNRKFYNIFSAGVNPLHDGPQWSYGYGFGTERELGKKWLLDVDLVCNQVQENTKSWTEDLNLLNQLKLSLAFKPGNRTALFAGPTVNVAVSRVYHKDSGMYGSGIIPDWASFDETDGNTRVAIWAGFHAGVRF